MPSVMEKPAHQQVVRQLAARYRGKRIGLLGGSFNPAHDGHIAIALNALKKLELDAVWLMVSPGNPLKPTEGMAPLKARMESARKLATHPRILVTDIEQHLGTTRTLDTVQRLKAGLPATRFVWLMGADNLQQFHRWHAWRHIADELPIAIFDRPGYPVTALASRFAAKMWRFRTAPRRLIQSGSKSRQSLPRWAFVTMVREKASATAIRASRGSDWYRKN